MQNQQQENTPPYLLQRDTGVESVTDDIANGLVKPEDTQKRAMRDAVMGRASADAFDPMLAMEGIVNGDPIGMETFDLGFFEDGTPAIKMGKGAIPVDQSMWMSLMTMRNKTRNEMDEMMRFEREKARATDAVTRLIRANPRINPEMQEALIGLSGIYPEFVVKQVFDSVLPNMAYDNGKVLTNDLQSVMMDTLGQATAGRLLSPRSRPVTLDPQKLTQADKDAIVVGSKEVPIPSIRDEAYQKAMASGRTSHATALNSLEFFTRGGEKRRARGQKGMPTTGLFDVTLDADGNSGENPVIWWAMQLASDRDLFPNDYVDIPINANKPDDVFAYMARLSDWSKRNFGYGQSDPVAMQSAFNFIVQKMVAGNASLQQNVHQSEFQTPTAPAPSMQQQQQPRTQQPQQSAAPRGQRTGLPL